jgi:hypothetical protein
MFLSFFASVEARAPFCSYHEERLLPFHFT